MNTSHWWSKEQFKVLLSAIFITGATFTSPIYANPNGGTVAAGQASISNSGNTTTINQSSDRAVINWQGFSINGNEVTQFNQPSSSSMTLNRVTSANNPSQILGQLKANGRVMLINPAGIVFGPNSKVDVAGLIASTANVDDNQFMNSANNKFTFTQDLNNKAGIVNHGTITVADRGLVALVAPAVSNNGTINARLGKVALASGNKTTVDMYGDKLIQFAADNTPVNQQTVDADGNVMPDAVRNSGKIYADGGVVQISANTAENVVNNVVNMDGVVQARAVGSQNGVVILDGGNAGITKVSGTIDVAGLNTGERGGEVHVLGHKVGVMSGAHINASGKAGGGKVLVGGDYQGQGDVRHAKVTYVDKNATIEADATDQGDGGKIVVWSDETTRAYGTLSAQGGPNGGNGGLIETSSHGYLDVEGSNTNINSATGKGGTWLLDPTSITISVASDSNGHFVDVDGNETWTIVSPSTSNISYTTLNNLLNTATTGSTIIISTASAGCIGCAGNITIGNSSTDSSNYIYKSDGGNDVTLQFIAANNIIINRPIGTAIFGSSPQSLNLEFTAGAAQPANNGVGGTIQFNWNGSTGGSFPFNTPILQTNGGSVTFNGDVLLNTTPSWGAVIDTAAYDTGEGGNITFAGKIDNGSSNLSSNQLFLAMSGGNVAFQDAIGSIRPVPTLSINPTSYELPSTGGYTYSTSSVTAADSVSVGTLNILNTEAITFNDDLTVTTAATFSGNNSTTSTLTFNNQMDFILSGSGSFSESNFAQINLDGSLINQTDNDFVFEDPIVLTQESEIAQEAANKDLIINQITGNYILTLRVNNGGTIEVTNNLGTTNSPLAGISLENYTGSSNDLLLSLGSTSEINADFVIFQNPVTITSGGTNTINAQTDIAFDSTLDASGITLNLSVPNGTITFSDDVTAGTLTTSSSGGHATIFHGENFSALANLTFNNPVEVTATDVLFSSTNGNITFADTLDGASRITIDGQSNGSLVRINDVGLTTQPTGFFITSFDYGRFSGNTIHAEVISITVPLMLTSSDSDLDITSSLGSLTLNGIIEPNPTIAHNINLTSATDIFLNNEFGGNGTDSNGDGIIEYPLNSITFRTSGSGLAKIYNQSNLTNTVSIYTAGDDGITFDMAIDFRGSPGVTLSLNALYNGDVNLDKIADNGSGTPRTLEVNAQTLNLNAAIDNTLNLSGNVNTININHNDVRINQALAFDGIATTINTNANFHITENVVMDRTTAVTLNGNGTYVNSFTQNSGDLTLTGDWIAPNSFDFSDGTLTFSGNTSLTSPLVFFLTTANITFDNTVYGDNADVTLQADRKININSALGSSSSPFHSLTVLSTPEVDLNNAVYADQITGTSVHRVNVTSPGSITVGGKLVENNGFLYVAGGTYNENVVFNDSGKSAFYATALAPVIADSFTSSLNNQINIGGTWQTAAGGSFTWNGVINLDSHTTFTALSANGNGGNITVNTLTSSNSANTLNFNAEGTISLLAQIGTSGTPLASVNFNDSNIVSLYDTIYTNDLIGAVSTVNLHTQAFSLNDIQDIIRNGGQLNIDAANYNEDFVVGKPLGIAAIGGTVQVDSMNITQASRLGGTWLADTGDITIAQPTTLTSNTSLTVSDGNITVNGTVNGNYALVLTDNSSGNPTITVNGALGNSTPLNSFTVNGANATLLLGANISTQGSTITFNTPTLLTNNVNLSDTGPHGIFFNRILSGAYNLVATASNGIMNFVQVNVNNASLSGAQGVNGNVIVNGLTLGGSNGGIVNGVVGGFNDFRASIITKLAAGAAGDFIVNGCLVPGGCLNNKIDTTELLAEATPNSSDDDVCTAAAASKDPNAMKRCRDSIKIHKDLLPGVQANL